MKMRPLEEVKADWDKLLADADAAGQTHVEIPCSLLAEAIPHLAPESVERLRPHIDNCEIEIVMVQILEAPLVPPAGGMVQ